jgi:hypothetical protein
MQICVFFFPPKRRSDIFLWKPIHLNKSMNHFFVTGHTLRRKKPEAGSLKMELRRSSKFELNQA